jgi:hypothetical protein
MCDTLFYYSHLVLGLVKRPFLLLRGTSLVLYQKFTYLILKDLMPYCN